MLDYQRINLPFFPWHRKNKKKGHWKRRRRRHSAIGHARSEDPRRRRPALRGPGRWTVTRRNPKNRGHLRRSRNGCWRMTFPQKTIGDFTGVGNCPMTWEYWTSPKTVAIIDHIPNGWVMFNGDI